VAGSGFDLEGGGRKIIGGVGGCSVGIFVSQIAHIYIKSWFKINLKRGDRQKWGYLAFRA